MSSVDEVTDSGSSKVEDEIASFSDPVSPRILIQCDSALPQVCGQSLTKAPEAEIQATFMISKLFRHEDPIFE